MSPPADESDSLRSLSEALQAPDSELDAAHLALLMSQRYYPDLDVNAYLRLLDELAARAKAHLARGRTPARVITALNTVLFEEEGFTGNVEEYYDPRNSFLSDVLERKTGIPISLSVVYLAVGQRLKQPIEGVGLPLHFIVKYAGEKGDIYIDPFHRGKILTVKQCREQVERSYGAPINFQPSYLDAVSPRMILYRMLNNLKYIFLRRQDYHNAGRIVDQMLLVRPDQAEEVRDRGLLYYQERRWHAAAEFLSRYLHENPHADDIDFVRTRLNESLSNRARRN